MDIKAQDFFNGIDDYKYINDGGWLDLELFIAYLNMCFSYDFKGGVWSNPNPNHVYQCLLDLISENYSCDEVSKYVKRQNLTDWEPNNPVYCLPVRTCIHMGAMIRVQHEWINNIGEVILGIESNKVRGCYYEWVKPEWVFVRKFINGYHLAHHGFLRDFSEKMKPSVGYSVNEALELSYRENIDFEVAVDKLKSEEITKYDAVIRIRHSIDMGFFLEAVVLQECLFSHFLLQYLNAKKIKPKTESFYDVLQEYFNKKIEINLEVANLVRSVDGWRRRRNDAVHCYVSSRQVDLKKTHEDFMSDSKVTANEGMDLLEQILVWYGEEARHFLHIEWESPQSSQAIPH